MREISVRGVRSLGRGPGAHPGKAVCVQRKHALLPATLSRPHPANSGLRHAGGTDPFARAHAAVFPYQRGRRRHAAEDDGTRWRGITGGDAR